MTTVTKTHGLARLLPMLPLLAVALPTYAGAPQTPPSVVDSPLGSTWADAARMPDLFTGMWMTFSGFVEGDKRLNVPFTDKAQQYVAGYKHKRDIPYAQEGCQSPGLPLTMRLGGGIKFSFAPGMLSIYMQAVGHTRFIKMNQPLGKTSPKYYGNSVGHWEGDTLVVETHDFLPEITFQYGVGEPLPPLGTIGTASLGPPPGLNRKAGPGPGPGPGAPPLPPGFPPLPGGASQPNGDPPLSLEALTAAIWGPHGEGMYMVERMRLVDPDTLQIKLAIHDDTVWTQPYVSQRTYRRLQKGQREIGPFNGEPEEWVCTLSVTNFDPETNTYVDKDPEEMVKLLDSRSK